MERVPTGIKGLDELIQGGFPKGSVVLVTGTCGTGKTITALQFLWEGIKNGESVVYISFEESINEIKNYTRSFGWDFETAEKNGKAVLVRYDPFSAEDVIEWVTSSVRKVGATRIAIDTISALGMYIRDTTEIRRAIFNLIMTLYKLGVTALITSEMLPDQKELSRFGVEEFLADGVIVYYYTKVDTYFARALTIWKMRYTNHSQKIHPYRITDKGIVVYPHEESALAHML